MARPRWPSGIRARKDCPDEGFRGVLGVATAIGAIQVNDGWRRGGSVGRLSRIGWLYIGAVVVAALVVVAAGPFTALDWGQIVVLGLLLIACESAATVVSSRGLAWSANTMAALAAVVLCGPVGAAVVSCGTLLGLRRGPSAVQRLFNTGMYVLSAYLAGRAFVAFGGPVGTPPHAAVPAS